MTRKPLAVMVAAALCGCGRLHFDPLGGGAAGGDAAAPVDVPAGARLFAYTIDRDNPISTVSSSLIAILSVDPVTGMMTEQPPYDLGVIPSSLAPTSDGKLLFVASRAAGLIYTFQIDPTTGALTQYATVSPTAAWPYSMTIHPSGRYLYTAAENTTPPEVWGYSIATDGALAPLPGSPWGYAGFSSNFVAIDPSGAWLFAEDDSPSIYGFAIQPDGTLVVQPSSVWNSGDDDPHATLFTPSGKYGFVAPDASGGVPGCTLDVTTGLLTTTPGSKFSSGASVSEFEAMSPAGDLLFMPVEDITLAVYAIAGDGSVAHVPGSPLITPNTSGTVGVAASPYGGLAIYTDEAQHLYSVQASTAGVSIVHALSLTAITAPTQIVMTAPP